MMNARNLGFLTGSFDLALSGFMGWYDCFDFVDMRFTKPDSKAPEIRRVLRDGGRFVACSWEVQEDITWMEEAILRHYPAILQDEEYLRRRPIGTAYEKAEGYEIILPEAGFRQIEISKENMTFVSTDEEEWWRMMEFLGWDSLVKKIGDGDPKELWRVKEAVFSELQAFKQHDGFHFRKAVFFATGVK
jgi:SAM-dependent methyltransferase